MNRINTEYSNRERRKSAAIAIENERVQKEIIRQKQGEMINEAQALFSSCVLFPSLRADGTAHMRMFEDGIILYWY